MKRHIRIISFFLAILVFCVGVFLRTTPGYAQQPAPFSFLDLLHNVSFHHFQWSHPLPFSHNFQLFHLNSNTDPSIGTSRLGGRKYSDCQLVTDTEFSCEGSRLSNVQTPASLRAALGLNLLLREGFTGKGQTVVVIDSFGSPTLQQDLNTFSTTYNLPKANLRIITPLPLPAFDVNNNDMMGWAGETTLDVETIHAIAPDANIVLLPSPVSETEGIAGFPEFLHLEQYAVNNHLGQIFSQSYGASELTLKDSAGLALVAQYNNFYRQIATQDHITVLTASGDHGATDVLDASETPSHQRTTSFPADVPWVTTVGGASLYPGQPPTTWQGSGGGVSSIFAEPDYQKQLSPALQNALGNRRGVPDVAANADPATAMPIYFNGSWQLIGGTSASTPQWAAIIAIANQMAGRPLGFINPALYRLGNAPDAQNYFTDITTGNNDSPDSGVTGYQARPGWDMATGWGLPNAAKLLPALIAAISQ